MIGWVFKNGFLKCDLITIFCGGKNLINLSILPTGNRMNTVTLNLYHQNPNSGLGLAATSVQQPTDPHSMIFTPVRDPLLSLL